MKVAGRGTEFATWKGVGGWHSMSFERSPISGVAWSRAAGLIMAYADKDNILLV